MEEAECAINVFEGGSASMLFSSGMGAMTTVFSTYLAAGDHVVSYIFLNVFSSPYTIYFLLIETG